MGAIGYFIKLSECTPILPKPAEKETAPENGIADRGTATAGEIRRRNKRSAQNENREQIDQSRRYEDTLSDQMCGFEEQAAKQQRTYISHVQNRRKERQTMGSSQAKGVSECYADHSFSRSTYSSQQRASWVARSL